jgi:3-oxoacyl-[acyl-carrier protein] reductase
MAEKGRKVAVVTGAGRGIGRATAMALAREGYVLSLAARTFEELEETRRMTGLAPQDSLIILLDLADRDAAENLFDATINHFGRVDVLINNAGWAPARTPLVKLSYEDLDRILAVNLRAPLALARLCADKMAGDPAGGWIVNVASTAARNCLAGETVYAAAKTGLIAFTQACFKEFRGTNVRTTVILPGLTDTRLIPTNKRLNRATMLRPDDVAATIVHLLQTPAHLCPIEIVLEPSHDPLRS